MNFNRSPSQRGLFGYTFAAALALGVCAAPAYAAKTDTAKPADKRNPAKAAAPAKPDRTKAAKPAAKPAAAKAAKKKSAHKPVAAKPDSRVPVPRPRPQYAAAAVSARLAPTPILPTMSFAPVTPAAAATLNPAQGALEPPPPVTRALAPPSQLRAADSATTPTADVALVKQAVDLVRRGRTSEATAIKKSVSDPLAQKLVEWTILRSDESPGGFDRLNAFISANPSWPNATMLRRRAESALWDERRDLATVRAFFGSAKPLTAKGRFTLARAYLADGDRATAAQLVRQAWREDSCSREVERMVMESLGDLLTRADHKARMDRRLYDEDIEGGLRMAQLLGGADLAIAKAREAVIEKSSKAGALLEAVPAAVRHDPGYIFSKVQWLRRQDRIAEAGQLLLAVPRNAAVLHDLDEWWVERKLVARKLLDEGDHKTAYRVARDAVSPPKELYRGEHEFTAGWIALRFLNDAHAAAQHFARVGHGTSHPTTLARSEYWQGRAAETAGRTSEARAHYQAAARYPTAYYGQIARARLGLGELELRRPPAPANRAALMNLEVVRATQLLYQIDARDLVIPFVSDLADRAADPGALVAVAEIAKKHDDARAMLLIGKGALARGIALDVYAFPTIGIPPFRIVGPPVDKSVVYSIARQESAFNPRAVSSAKALGLMQVLPGTGKQIAKKFGFPFDQRRMLSDAAYNAQMGAAELGDVLESYRGSYILSFVAYNAGRGRVKQWIEKYGDPRDPGVDPIDWVERIPFSETRNYVQRVLENMQVYRAQLGHSARPTIEADLRRGSAAN
jgi:soluble lytic murein transglycosylase